MTDADTGHHSQPATVTMHHAVTDATIVVRSRLQAHYETRGWELVDDQADTIDPDVQVVEPCDFEPAYIYDADRDHPGDLAGEPGTDPGDGVEKTGIEAPADGETVTELAAAGEPTNTDVQED